MKSGKTFGKVILAGAGPGDPDLITVKALRWLQTADVIICDRLVSPELVAQNRKPGSRLIEVGKEAGQANSTSQAAINNLLVASALTSSIVLRLKGGDVSFFSNLLDELQVLNESGIPFEIVPGVTAASGASAAAGIPLTARGFAAGVRFLSYITSEPRSQKEWSELAATSDTLVFYMGSRYLDDLVSTLRLEGVAPEKGLAVIEQATTPNQYVHTTSFENYEVDLQEMTFQSPTLIVIGAVVDLHSELHQPQSASQRKPYFNSLARTQIQLDPA